MTVLVTGASGFVGAAVLRRLLAANCKVRILLRPNSPRGGLNGVSVEPVIGDLTDPQSLRHAVRGCQALFHVAADYRLWVPDPEPMYRANVVGTRQLMEAALAEGLERIVYTSSVATLGTRGDGRPADEDTPVTLNEMIGHYKRSKFLAEQEVRQLAQNRGLPAVIVNPSTPVGPGDVKPTPTGRMVLDAARGRIPAYVDTGLNIVHVDDVAEGHWLAYQHGTVGERYILGGDNLTLRDILTRIAVLSGRPPPRLRLRGDLLLPLAWGAETWTRLRRKGRPLVTIDELRMARKRMFFSSAKAQRILGYRSRPAQQALADALAWFRRQGLLA